MSYNSMNSKEEKKKSQNFSTVNAIDLGYFHCQSPLLVLCPNSHFLRLVSFPLPGLYNRKTGRFLKAGIFYLFFASHSPA